MDNVLDILVYWIGQIFGNPGIFYAIIAALGLILLKEKTERIITGTMRTYIGFFILLLGANSLTTVITPVRDWTLALLGVQGIIPQNWLIFSKAMADYGTLVGIVGLLGFLLNLVLARFTKLKGVYLTGHIILIWASYFVGVAVYYKFPVWFTVTLASIALGLYLWLHASLTYFVMKPGTPGAERITSEWSMGIGEAFGILTTCWLAKKIGKREENAEEIAVSEKWSWLKDPMLGVSFFSTFLFLILGLAAAIKAGPQIIQKSAGGTNWVLFLLLQGLGFGASLAALLYGVRMLIAELVPAFKGIAEKVVPGAIAGLDYPTIFPYGPTSLFLGFISNFIGGILATIVMVLIKYPVIVLPAIWMNFWTGAVLGIFANAYGGRRAAIIVPFIWGFIAPFFWGLAYPLSGIFQEIGATQDYTDYVLIGPLYGGLVKLLAGIFGS
jgi:PTS system ascorbate-specific IIC component